MAEAKTITLPLSGAVLTFREGWGGYDLGLGDGFDVNLGQSTDGSWAAWVSHLTDATRRGTRDECVAWLDAEVMKIRAALLPPGAIVVSDSEETRERVAKAMLAAHAERYSLTSEPDGETVKASRQYADAVLAALKEAPRG